MATMNVQKDVGDYLTNLMKAELTHVLGREKYERNKGQANHATGAIPGSSALKGLGR